MRMFVFWYEICEMFPKCISGARQHPLDRLQNIAVPYWLRVVGEEVTPTQVPLYLLAVVEVVFVDSSGDIVRIYFKRRLTDCKRTDIETDKARTRLAPIITSGKLLELRRFADNGATILG